MNCKNCESPLEKDAFFCDNCGARVVKSRITLSFLLQELFSSFGWDSLYFNTLKKMITEPNTVLSEYLEGTRKKYVNPFAFLALAAAISLITFNIFKKEFVELSVSANKEQFEEIQRVAAQDLSKLKDISPEELVKLQKKQASAKFSLKFNKIYFGFFINYFNIVAFLFLPLYALMSKWTYRKPHNYGEHIIMNAYLQGITLYISVIAFFLAILIHPNIYLASTILFIIYYLYAFAKLYNQSFKTSLKKLLRFVVVTIIVILTIALITGIGVIIYYKVNR